MVGEEEERNATLAYCYCIRIEKYYTLPAGFGYTLFCSSILFFYYVRRTGSGPAHIGYSHTHKKHIQTQWLLFPLAASRSHSLCQPRTLWKEHPLYLLYMKYIIKLSVSWLAIGGRGQLGSPPLDLVISYDWGIQVLKKKYIAKRRCLAKKKVYMQQLWNTEKNLFERKLILHLHMLVIIRVFKRIKFNWYQSGLFEEKLFRSSDFQN